MGQVIRAAEYAAYDVLVYLCEGYYRLREIPVARVAARTSFRCLKYLIDTGCPYDETVLQAAVQNRDSRCVDYLLERRAPVDNKVYINAARHGNVYALKKMDPIDDIDVKHKMMEAAASGCHLEVIKYLSEVLGVKITPFVCNQVAKLANLTCLTYVVENCQEMHDRSDHLLLRERHDALFCLVLKARNTRNETSAECVKYVYERFKPKLTEAHCSKAARVRDLESLKFLRSVGCPWDEKTAISAVKSGSLECLRYVADHGCDLGTGLYEHSIKAFQPHLFKYLFNRKYPLKEGTLKTAAEYGCATILRIAHEGGVPMGEDICLFAAKEGHLACMKYAHSIGSPWENSCDAAATGGFVECLKFAREHGAEWDEDCTRYAAEGGHYQCLHYAIENDCPYNLQELLQAASVAYSEAIEDPIKRKECFDVIKYLEELAILKE